MSIADGIIGYTVKTRSVVSSLNGEAVILTCELPNGNQEIEVPTSSIPNGCAHYGALVWVYLDIRNLRVIPRIQDGCVEPPKSIDEINAWLTNGD